MIDFFIAASSTIFGLESLVLTMIYSDGGTTANRQFTLGTFEDPSELSTSLAAATYSSTNGNTWFKITQVGSSPNTLTATGQQISWNSMMITDYRSNTTIVVTAWQDGFDDATHIYNHIYMVSVSLEREFLIFQFISKLNENNIYFIDPNFD